MPSVDFLTKSQRSERMAKIRSSGTKPEIKIAKALRQAGFRFREQVRSIAGKLDFAHRKRKMAIFVHECFWHGHSCQGERVSATRPAFWSQKIAANKRRDARNIRWLRAERWKMVVVWECRIRSFSGLARETRRILREWNADAPDQVKKTARSLRSSYNCLNGNADIYRHRGVHRLFHFFPFGEKRIDPPDLFICPAKTRYPGIKARI